MKTKFIHLVVLLCLGIILIPCTSQAQLGGLKDILKKNKKKVETSTSSDPAEVASEALVTISDEDLEKSNKLAREFSSFFKFTNMNFRKLASITIENHWSPTTMRRNLEKANKNLQFFAGDGAKKFYEENKTDIERFLKVAQGKYSPNTNERKVADTWSQYGGSYNYGYQAYEEYKKLGGKNYKPEDAEEFWKNDGNGMDFKGLKITADYVIELAYQEKDKEQREVIKLLQTSLTTLDLFKSLLPEGSSILTEANNLEKETKAALNDMGVEELEKIFINDFHKANAGKIFFSKKPIDPKTANASTFATDFTINDEIYAIAYFDASLLELEIIEEQNDGYNEATKTYNKKAVFDKYKSISFDGKSTMMRFVAGDWGEMAKQGYLLFSLKPNLDKADNQGAIEGFAKTISEKSPRTHTIPVRFASTQGDLTISLSGMNKEKVLADAAKAIEKAKAEQERSKLLSRGLPKQFENAGLYSHSFKPVSFAQVKQLIETNLKKGYGAAKVDALVVQDGDKNQTGWDVKVNSFGVPVSRSGPGYYVAYTGTDGNCYHYYFYIFQKYQGGSYGPTTNGTPSGVTPTQYNCAKKKFAK